MFISSLVNGHYYLAERARRGGQFVWVKLPHAPTHNGVRVDPVQVPRAIRLKAYKLFERDRLREDVITFRQGCIAAEAGADAQAIAQARQGSHRVDQTNDRHGAAASGAAPQC